MNKYLYEKNNELQNKLISKSSINSILLVGNDSEDDIIKIILKYQSLNEEFNLNDNELSLINKELKNNYHILIRIILNYFITFSKECEKSRLFDCCKEYINMLFDNIKGDNGNISFRDLCIIIKWTLARFPRYKKELSSILFDKIINGEQDAINYLLLSNSLLSDEDISNILNFSQYEDIYNKYLVDTIDHSYIDTYLDIYENYYKYASNNKKKVKKSFSKRYCDFVMKNINLIDNHRKRILLRRIRDIMNELDCYDDFQYSIIDDNLELANKETLASLKQITISVSQDKNVQISDYINKQNESFTQLSNGQKLDKLLFELLPLSINKITKSIKDGEKIKTISSLFQDYYCDEDGKVMNYKKLSNNEMFSLKANQYILCSIESIFDLLITPFFNNFTTDSTVKDYLKNVMTNNALINNDRIELMIDNFSTFLEKNFKNSI